METGAAMDGRAASEAQGRAADSGGRGEGAVLSRDGEHERER
jgi:hypothetical protein